MKVKVKKLHSDAKIPKYAKSGDAGMDLYTTSEPVEDLYGNLTYHTGLAMEIPDGYVGLIFPRSSVYKTPHSLRNHVGVIDSGYRGEIMLKFSKELIGEVYSVGDRVAQIIIMPYPKIDFVEVDSLSKTARGDTGFGSSGQ